MTRRRLISLIGSLIVVISIGFICYRFFAQDGLISQLEFTGNMLLVVVGATVFYSCACFFLTSAWSVLVTRFSGLDVDRWACDWIYAKTQLGKYIPGNVLHIAGRHLLSRELGLSHGVLGLSAVAEIAGLLAASGSLTLLGVCVLGFESNIEYPPWLMPLLLVLILAVLLLASFLWVKFRHRFIELITQYKPAFYVGLPLVYLRYVGFFIAAGAALLIIVYSLGGDLNVHNVSTVIMAFAVSWFVGFVTPGAPSGIGVREAALVLLLEQSALPISALVAALLLRLATVGGDVLFFILMWLRQSRFKTCVG